MIKSKEKPCKGAGKAKGYGCKKPSNYRKYGLCSECWRWFLLNTEEGKSILEKTTLRASRKVDKEKRAEKNKKDKETKIKLSDWKGKLQEKINEISRFIDHGQPCIARRYHPNMMHAGHVYSRGSHPSMKFNLHNIHRQSAQSNHFQNEDGLLRSGLVDEYGQDYFDFLTSLRGYPALKYSNEEYHSFYQKACKIALRLKRDGKVFSLTERIEQRNMINIELGIYSKTACSYELKTNPISVSS